MTVVRKIFFWLLLAMLSLSLAGMAALQAPSVQKAVTTRISSAISGHLNGSLSIGRIYLVPFSTLMCTNVEVLGPDADTIATAGKLLVNIRPASILGSRFSISRIALERSSLKIEHLSEETTNIARLLDGLFPESDGNGIDIPWDEIAVGRLRVKDLSIEVDGKKVLNHFGIGAEAITYSESGLNLLFSHIDPDGGMSVEVSGFEAQLRVSDTLASLTGLRYGDNYSDIDIPEISLRFDSYDDLADSPASTGISLIIGKSKLGLGTLGPLISSCAGKRDLIDISGTVTGTVGDASIDRLEVATPTGASRISLSAAIEGLPDVEHTGVDLSIKDSYTTLNDLQRILEHLSVDFNSPSGADGIGDMRIGIEAAAAGGPERVRALFQLSSDIGKVNVSAKGWKSGKKSYTAEGAAIVHNLDIGRVTGDGRFGNCSLLIAGTALAGEVNAYSIDDLRLQELVFNGYSYKELRGNGQYSDGHFKVNASCEDPNLRFNLSAETDIRDTTDRRAEFLLDLPVANLFALNLADGQASVSLRARADATSSKEDDILGRLDINNLKVSLGKERFDIGNIECKSIFSGGTYNAVVESDVFNANYNGSAPLAKTIHDIVSSLGARIAPESGHSADISVITGDIRPILSILCPRMYINPGTKLELKLKESSEIEIDLSSGLMAYNDLYIKDVSARIDNAPGHLSLNSSAGMVQSGTAKFLSAAITAEALEDRVDTHLSFDNTASSDGSDDVGKHKADLKLSFSFPDTTTAPERMIARIEPSSAEMNGRAIAISPSIISFRKGAVDIDSVMIADGDGHLLINGTISDSAGDTLRLDVKHFNLAHLCGILVSPDVALKGFLSGSASAWGLLGKDMAFFTALGGKDISVGGSAMGEMTAMCKWDATHERINVLVSNNNRGKVPFNLSGWYRPSDKSTEMNVALDSLSLNWVPAIAPAVFSDMDGTVSGFVHLGGTTDSLLIASHGTRLNNVYSVVDYTRVPYYLDGPFSINRDGITLDGINLRDTEGHRGKVTGGVAFNGFKNTTLDLNFKVNEILAINTTFQNVDDGFYGRAYGTGKVRIYGPVKGLKIDIDALAESGSIHIPISDSYKRKNSLLTFVNARKTATDAYDSLMNVKRMNSAASVKRLGVATTINLEVTPATTLSVDLNSTSSDVINAGGSGKVEIVTGNNSFDIKGIYTISEGNCKMSILGISAKDFAILSGGTVNFNGDIMKSEFDVTARYATKASIEPLIGDNSSVSTRRTVYSEIHATGNLTNPVLKFKVEVPDLDPATMGRVESALSTDEKNLRQSMALLVSGSFVPDENGGIINNSTILYSNASEIISNQVSNIFHQLDIPVDLGFKYQPGTSGVNIFDVAVSTQLFNNRVTINGSLGNQQYMTGGASTEVVGNIDVEIKLNKSGRWRLNLFSHAADKYSNYLDQTQRNGAGIVFQEEFNTWKELWHNLFKRSPRKENR